MARKRLYEIARELGRDNTEVFEMAKKLGLPAKSHSSTVGEDEALRIRKILLGKESMPEEKKERPSTILRKAKKPEPSQEVAPPPPPPVVTEVLPPPPQEPSPPSVPPLKESLQSQEPAPTTATTAHARPSAPTGPAAPALIHPQPQVPQDRKKKKKGIRPPTEVQLLQKKVVVKDTLEPAPEPEAADYKLFNYYDTTSLYPQAPSRKKKKIPPSKKDHKKPEAAVTKPEKRIIRIVEGITVGTLSQRMGVKIADIMKKLMDMGVMAAVNQIIDPDTADIIAREYGFEVEKVSSHIQLLADRAAVPAALQPRPPVVTVMGHVDHGKTTLLDAIRQTRVAESESGGITQHIGASVVEAKGKKIIFLDTPGHEAFSHIRARGAQATDIVVLVVAADDGVMPQTLEAISHAQAAKVPIVVAINKIDKPEARSQQVMTQLSDKGLIPEKWGGDTLYAMISAKQKKGIDELLDLILLQAEVLDLKADPTVPARGTVIEARLDRGRGPIATLLVKEGVLRTGDPIVTGMYGGKLRAMLDDRGNRIIEGGPSTPVEVIGLSGVPRPGEAFMVVTDERAMRDIIDQEEARLRTVSVTAPAKVTLEDLYKQTPGEDVKQLNIVLKADVVGSAEAIQEALKKLPTDAIKLSVIHSGVGAVTESDVMLASASHSIIVGFSVRPDARASDHAEREKVEVRTYTIIYDLISDITKAMEGLLKPTFKEKVVGRALVKQPFTIGKVGTIAGSMVNEGKVTRGISVRILRDGAIVHTGRISSLRHFKEDVKEVSAGMECGIGIENFNDIKAGDIIETFELEKISPKLDVKPS